MQIGRQDFLKAFITSSLPHNSQPYANPSAPISAASIMQPQGLCSQPIHQLPSCSLRAYAPSQSISSHHAASGLMLPANPSAPIMHLPSCSFYHEASISASSGSHSLVLGFTISLPWQLFDSFKSQLNPLKPLLVILLKVYSHCLSV